MVNKDPKAKAKKKDQGGQKAKDATKKPIKTNKDEKPEEKTKPANKGKKVKATEKQTVDNKKTNAKKNAGGKTASKTKADGNVIHNIYVNGVFDRKNEENWKAIEAVLNKTFGGTSEQVHNKTLSIDKRSKEAKNFLWKHPMYMFMTGTTTYALLMSNLKDKVRSEAMAKTLTPLRLVLEKHAAEVSGDVWQALSKRVKKVEKRNDVKSIDKLTINIYAHSHGGMVIDQLIAGEAFTSSLKNKWLPKLPFEFQIRFFIAGCPIVVRKPPIEFATLQQIDNPLDKISLAFHGTRKVPKTVKTMRLEKSHKSIMYAKNLSNLL